MQVLEVVEGGARRLDNVTTAVVPPVLLEAETGRRTRDHLPQAGGAAVRIGERVVGAFDDRQQCELERQAATLQLVRNVRQIALGARENAIQVFRVADKPLQFTLDTAVLLRVELKSIAQAGQEVVGGRLYGLQLVPEAVQR